MSPRTKHAFAFRNLLYLSKHRRRIYCSHFSRCTDSADILFTLFFFFFFFFFGCCCNFGVFCTEWHGKNVEATILIEEFHYARFTQILQNNKEITRKNNAIKPQKTKRSLTNGKFQKPIDNETPRERELQLFSLSAPIRKFLYLRLSPSAFVYGLTVCMCACYL